MDREYEIAHAILFFPLLMANNKILGAGKQTMGVRTRIGSKSCGGVEGYGAQYLGGARDVLEASLGLCNVVGHASRRGQHEAGAVSEYERKEQSVGFLDLRNTTSWHFMKQDLPNLNDSQIYKEMEHFMTNLLLYSPHSIFAME